MRSVLVIIYFLLLSCKCQTKNEKKFFYFAYGSNLLKSRLQINVPSAVFITSAQLPRYRLDFDNYSSRWQGAPATIHADSEGVVWGAVWTIAYSDKDALDKQEGVNDRFYVPMDIQVFNLENKTITARTYQMTNYIQKVRPEDLPLERRPSNTYLQVIALGAVECGLPSSYIEYINRFKTNGRTAIDKLIQDLGHPFSSNQLKGQNVSALKIPSSTTTV